jgi:hypothetical protein
MKGPVEVDSSDTKVKPDHDAVKVRDSDLASWSRTLTLTCGACQVLDYARERL